MKVTAWVYLNFLRNLSNEILFSLNLVDFSSVAQRWSKGSQITGQLKEKRFQKNN